ncbi:MAG: hypothetical protein PF487_01550 [Bacteroidales bacterium]|jgi:hypothetical protein|nr:hypothetical protein [Bacteroidales bacterium]
MEFGRAIGLKRNKLVLKTYEGSALGKSVFLQHFKFGKDRLAEAINNPDFHYNDARTFVEDFILNKRLPDSWPKRNNFNVNLFERIKKRIQTEGSFVLFIVFLMIYPFKYSKRRIFKAILWFEKTFIKRMIVDQFDPTLQYFFLGFHLNQESTMALRSMPFTNQTALIEMISRVLPYNHFLYIREHPHWSWTFPAKYLAIAKSYPNVRLISPNISIHEILKNAKGILTYNATTGIEALIYNKPVLSFSSNLYNKHHPAVDYCSDLFELGEKLSNLTNRNVSKVDTYRYIQKIMTYSNDVRLGSDCFFSKEDSILKAKSFSSHFSKAIFWCLNN